MIAITDLILSYNDSTGHAFPVLDVPELELEPNRLVVVTGPSGSGKSSLLYVLSGLLAPTQGQIRIDEQDLYTLSEARRDRWRREMIGFIFQDFHLIDELSPLANVTLPLSFGTSGCERRDRGQRASDLLAQFGVPQDRKTTAMLSRGERQRTAIARALLFDPTIILADEPTASLDEASSAIVCDSLRSLARDDGRLVLAVSHDPLVIAAADTVYRLEHGKLAQQQNPAVQAKGTITEPAA